MMKLLKNKVFLAIAGALFAGGVILAAVLALSKDNKKNTPVTTPTPTPTQAVDTTDYKEVRFALPAGVSELDTKNTRLPETAMIPKGTKIADLASPRQMGKVFLGWYYDDNLKLMSGPDDTVENNMTLYARFGDRMDTQDIFSYDYVASENVTSDYPILVAAHNLSAEKVKESLAVRNMSVGGDDIVFSLEVYKKPEASEEKDTKNILTDADPREKEIKELLKKAGLDVDNFEGIPDLNEVYGLDPDDSPARYWREELELDVETVLAMQEAYEKLVETAWENVTIYQVVPEGGTWQEGRLYQVEIKDTSCMRFIVSDTETEKDIVYYNFSIAQEEFNNLSVSNEVVFIPLSDVTGIDKLTGLYTVSDDGSEVVQNNKSGSFVYKKGTLEPGTTVAVYNGKLGKDGRVDGEVGYFKISKALGDGKYEYGGAEITDVLFIPDVIPVRDDGSFKDGSVKLGADVLAFKGTGYEHLRLGTNTKVEPGDYLYFYTGKIKAVNSLSVIGVGRVTSVTQDGNGLLVKYDVSSVEEVKNFGMHEQIAQIPIPVDALDTEALMKNVSEKMEESAFAQKTGDYLLGILNGEVSFPDDPDMEEALRNMKFKREDGSDITVEELRLLAENASKVMVSDPDVHVEIGLGLEHFSGEGVRVVITAGFKITVNLNGNNKLEINVAAAFEQEIVLGANIDVYLELTDLENTTIDLSLRAGTFTGFGAQATVMTVEKNENEDTEWSKLLKATGAGEGTQGASKKLLNMAEKVGTLVESVEKVQGGGTYKKCKGPGQSSYTKDYDGASYARAGGDLPTKYKAMLENDAEYINLIEQKLCHFDFRPPGPFAVIDFTIDADLIVAFKVNAMIGFSISYGNAKQLCYHIEPFNKLAKSTTTDIESPNFRVDFFVFGMLGVRAGVKLDGRVGFLSTAFDSIGITAEVGLYAEVYGFLYVFYSWKAVPNSKQAIIEKGVMGSLLFEIGSYLEVNFVAQLGDGKLQKEIKIYDKKWPLIQLGATKVPVPFQDSSEDLAEIGKMLEIEKGKNTVKIPDVMFNVDMMELSSGDVSRDNLDSKKLGTPAYYFSINGLNYTQYNEEHFFVTCYDLDGKDGKVTENHSFQYLPATNEIYVKPVSDEADELWGIVTFTYRNNSFGFSTMEFSRTLKVHWKGEPCTAVVEYYIQKPGTSRMDAMYANKIADSYELVATGDFHGFDGIQYDLILSNDFVYKYPGYRLLGIDYPGIGDRFKAVEEAEKKYDEAKAKNKELKYDGEDHSYSEYKAASDAQSNALSEYWERRNQYTEYYDNIENALKTANGTVYFLMVKNKTIVRLYYDIDEYEVPMLRVKNIETGEMSSGNPFYYGYTLYSYRNIHNHATGTKGTATIGVNENLLEKAKELTANYDPAYDLEFYMYRPNAKEYTYRMGAREGLAKLFIYYNFTEQSETLDNPEYYRSHLSEWQRVTKDTKMPDDDIVLFVYEKKSTKSYKVTWVDDFGEVLREDMVVYDELIPDAPTTTARKRSGYDASYSWKDENGKAASKTYRMPTHDVTFTLKWTFTPTPQPITWEALGFTWTTKGPGTGQQISIYSAKYEGDKKDEFKKANRNDLSLSRTGYTTKVTVVLKNGKQIAWEDFDKKMPEGGLTLKYVFVPNQYKATWYDGDKIVKEEMNTYGGYLKLPEIPLGENEVVTWAYDAWDGSSYGIYDGYPVLSHDMVIRATRHTHVWESKVIIESTCSVKGWTRYTCKGCGETRQEQDCPLNPDNHEKYLYRTTRANCENPRVDEYHCLGCDKVWLENVGEKDPNYHYMYEATGHYTKKKVDAIPATCSAEGREEAYYCWDCGALLEGGAVIPKGPHDWGTPKYEWTADKSEVTATHICKTNSSHTETETVKSVSKIVKNATCDEKGQTEYTATFTKTGFTEQKEYTDIEKKEHVWGKGTYVLSADKRAVTASRTCKNFSSHYESETKIIKTEILKEATSTEEGLLKYYAVFDNTGLGTWSTTEVIPISVCSHTWTEKTVPAWVEIVGEGKANLHVGEKYQICSKCNIKKEGSTQEVPITVSVNRTKMDFYEYIKGGNGLPDLEGSVVSNIDLYVEPYVVLPTSPDGTGSFKLYPTLSLSMAKSYYSVTLKDLDAKFQKGTITQYVLPYTIEPRIIDYGNGEFEDVHIGYNEDGSVMVFGQGSYFAEKQGSLTLTSSHKHSWETETTPAEYYYGMWTPGTSYTVCKGCGLKKNGKNVLLKPYVYDVRTNKVRKQRKDNVYEFHIKVNSSGDDYGTSVNGLMSNELQLDVASRTISVLTSEEWMNNGWIWFEFFDLFYSDDGTKGDPDNGAKCEILRGSRIVLSNPRMTLGEGLRGDQLIYAIDSKEKTCTIDYDLVWRDYCYEKITIRLIIEPADD